RFSFSLGRKNIQVQPTNKNAYQIAPHRVLFLDRRCPDFAAVSGRISNPYISAQQHFLGSHLVGDTLSLDETKLNETKQFDLRQADSVVYQVHRLMSPIPKKMFSRSGIRCDIMGVSFSRESHWEVRNSG